MSKISRQAGNEERQREENNEIATLRYTGALLCLRSGAGLAEIGAFQGVKSRAWATKIYRKLK